MNKAKGLFFPAGMVLALAFTFSCLSDDGEEGGASVGNQKSIILKEISPSTIGDKK